MTCQCRLFVTQPLCVLVVALSPNSVVLSVAHQDPEKNNPVSGVLLMVLSRLAGWAEDSEFVEDIIVRLTLGSSAIALRVKETGFAPTDTMKRGKCERKRKLNDNPTTNPKHQQFNARKFGAPCKTKIWILKRRACGMCEMRSLASAERGKTYDGEKTGGASRAPDVPRKASHSLAIQRRTKIIREHPYNVQTIQTKKSNTAVNIVIQIDPVLGLHASKANSLSLAFWFWFNGSPVRAVPINHVPVIRCFSQFQGSELSGLKLFYAFLVYFKRLQFELLLLGSGKTGCFWNLDILIWSFEADTWLRYHILVTPIGYCDAQWPGDPVYVQQVGGGELWRSRVCVQGHAGNVGSKLSSGNELIDVPRSHSIRLDGFFTGCEAGQRHAKRSLVKPSWNYTNDNLEDKAFSVITYVRPDKRQKVSDFRFLWASSLWVEFY
ncbi:hypothetical protein K438DRAFT_1936057 [Mycena galopus ATCC 62051]|nr:hypothetical protein K438DRAFT_1936057 [Mycena galopus ATCC 62051]